MNMINAGYKLIAVASLSYALFSCTSSVQSQSNSEVLARLDAIEAKIDALTASVSTVETSVRGGAGNSRPCTVQEVIDQNYSACDQAKVPEGVSTATSYCINQGRAGQLGGAFKIEPEGVAELGGGWPNAIWGKITGKIKFPAAIPVGPVAIPLPNELTAGGSVSLGKGLNICVGIPVTALDASQVAQIHDLVRGVNETGGKYNRRTGRVINYAALRTPVAQINLATNDSYTKAQVEDADDAFDIADAAIESLIDGDFLVSGRGPMLFADPVFVDLASSLDLPTPMLDTINDPERVFDILQTIGQSNIASTCDVMGITEGSRARSPALANQCARFALYPNINNALNSLDFVADVRTRVNSMYTASGLRSFMCSNITLAVFAPNCP
jgi:hypothetical protein